MKFGVREICDVVLRAKDKVKIGNQTFEKEQLLSQWKMLYYLH